MIAANTAASIVVSKFGTSIVRSSELLDAIKVA